MFKGKLRACATRDKFTDAVDLRWLESRYSKDIRLKQAQLDRNNVGLAIKRYPELEILFRRVGVDIATALAVTSAININSLPSPAPGDVQKGILG